MSIRTPIEFFEHVAMPNYREFKARPGDIRRAMNAALSAAHMRDWMFAAHKGGEAVYGTSNLGAYNQKLVAIEPDFGRLCDVANATKHFETKGEKVGADAIHRDRFRVGDRVGMSLTPIRVRFGSRRVAIDELLFNAHAMWIRELRRHFGWGAAASAGDGG